MGLADKHAQGLKLCLAALKQQQRGLARRMDELRVLLEHLEAEDDAAVSQSGPQQQPSRFGSPDEQSASVEA